MSKADINYISLHEATKLTNYSQDYISLLCRQKKLKGEKLGRNWVTTEEWVENYINKTKGSEQNSSLSTLVFLRGIMLVAFAVGIFGVGFVFFQNNVSSFSSSVDKNNIKKESGIVAGVSDRSVEHPVLEKVSGENGLLVITPLEGEINSEENQKFIKKLSSDFFDDVKISPSEDGVSGVITFGENLDESYLYLMVPAQKF